MEGEGRYKEKNRSKVIQTKNIWSNVVRGVTKTSVIRTHHQVVHLRYLIKVAVLQGEQLN